MHRWRVSSRTLAQLGESLAKRYQVVVPYRGSDGMTRLRPFDAAEPFSPGEQPLLSLKKLLFPSHDPVWRATESSFELLPPVPVPLAALGLPPCDLHAVTLLDSFLGEDPAYRARREGLLLVGVRCTPQETCHCLVPQDPPPGDLFLDGETVWATSRDGEALLRELDLQLEPLPDAPFPRECWPARGELVDDLAQRLSELASDPLWESPQADCLACGACSAVCPTCICYDLLDLAVPGGETRRERRWDNCLFSNFALVAGGHDFRAGIRTRLQYRMQHKLLGFGEQTGRVSCVGCGRCERHCPVDIGPRELLERLTRCGRTA